MGKKKQNKQTNYIRHLFINWSDTMAPNTLVMALSNNWINIRRLTVFSHNCCRFHCVLELLLLVINLINAFRYSCDRGAFLSFEFFFFIWIFQRQQKSKLICICKWYAESINQDCDINLYSGRNIAELWIQKLKY